MFIIALTLVAAAAVYFMTPEERTRLLQATFALYRRLLHEAMRLHGRHGAGAADDDAPRTHPLVTGALAGTLLGSSVWVALAPGDLADPSTLVASGASFGPRTTNGEWWRLVTAGFLNAGVAGLLINVAALLQVCVVLERAAGRVAVIAVYLLGVVFSGLVTLAMDPVGVAVGASGGIFGLYGLLLASWMWGVFDRSAAVRLRVVTGLAPGALVFVLYHATTGELPSEAHVASVTTGFLSGVLLARGAHVRSAPAVRFASTVLAGTVVAIAAAAPLRGLTDIRPHIAHLVSVEKTTAAAYDEQVAQFRRGRTTVEALSRLIERQILPELKAAGTRLNALQGVPAAHQPLGAAARRFFDLRVESWQLRLRGLRKASMPILRDADAVENRSQDLLRQVVAGQSSGAG